MPASTWKNRNIFEDVLCHEDSLTDALRNFLKYRPVRDALWRTLPENVREHVSFSSIEGIETHPSRGHLGEPDLVLYRPDFILVIEVKIGAELQPAQQKAYVPWLREELQDSQIQRGFVTFLIPDAYPHRKYLDSCLEKARSLCRSNNSNIAVLNSIRWQEFVKKLESQDIPSLNELTREFYDHLYERFKPVRFSPEEVRLMHSRKTASGILKLMKVVEEVKANLKSSGLHQIFDKGHDYGYDFSFQERSVWFGIWWLFWAEEDFPLCIAIREDNPQAILDAFREKYGNRVQEFEEDGNRYLVVGFELPEAGTDCNKRIDEIVQAIENLLREDGAEPADDGETP